MQGEFFSLGSKNGHWKEAWKGTRCEGAVREIYIKINVSMEGGKEDIWNTCNNKDFNREIKRKK